MEKNQEFIVTIEDMNEDGAGVGKVDGYIWFVKDAVIGDVVRAKAMKIKKSYGFARLMEVLEPSVSRVIPSCPVARQCGGCQLQAMSYEEQLKFKERKVMNNLIRIGKFAEDEIHMLPIMGMEEPWRYRNKAQFPFGKDKDGNVIAGFYAGRTHAIVEAEDCLLGVEENREILDIVKQFMREMKIEPYDEISHKGLVRHVLIRKGFKTGEIMVCLVINGKKLPGKERLVEMLTGGDGKDGKDAAVLRIDSSRGTVFKNNQIKTTLAVVIYFGENRITNKAELTESFGASAYLEWSWQRMDENTFGVISASDSRIRDHGFSLDLTPEDVDTKATFMCKLII